MLKKLIALSATAALACAAAADTIPDSEWKNLKEQARDRRRAVIYDNDSDDAAAFPRKLAPTDENFLALRTSFLHKYPVDTIVYNASYGPFYQLVTPTRVGEVLDVRRDDSAAVTSIVPVMHARGTDPLKLQIEYARKHNIEFFAGIRVNDTHDAADRPGNPYPSFSKWKREHPELLSGTVDRMPPYGEWSSLDFARPEVRDRFVAVVDELTANYDVDGVAIDLFRFLNLLKSVAWGAEASNAERDAISDMFRKVRAVTEKRGRERGRPILIAVRAPDSPAYCRAIGFDLERLMREGAFDIFFAADNLHLEPWEKSAELCRKYGVKCYASISMPSFLSLPKLSRHDPRSYHGRVAAAWRAGMDGMYYFNLFNENSVRKLMLGGDAAFKTLDKRYHISDRVLWRPSYRLATGEKYNHMPELSPSTPVRLSSRTKRAFKLEFGDDIAALRREGIPVAVKATVIGEFDPKNLAVSANGVRWKHVSSSGDWHFFDPGEGMPRPGVNTIEFANLAAPGETSLATIYSGERLLRGEEQHPWRRLFPGNADHSQAETIVDGACRFADSGGGWANLLYPLDGGTKSVDFEFELKVDSASDELGAAIRVACGGGVEIVSFSPEGVSLKYAGKSVKFPAARFHRYRLRFDGAKIMLDADGRTLLSASTRAKSADPETEMRGMVLAIPGMHTDSIVIGSLSDAGSGVSHWKNLALRRPVGDADIQEFAVDVRFSPPPAPRAVTDWPYSNRGEALLEAGNFAYKIHPVTAEIELAPESGSTTVLVSGGGTFTRFTVSRDRIEFEDGLPPLPLAVSGGTIKLRVEFENLEAKLFAAENYVEFPAKSVSIAMRDDARIKELDEKSAKILRNSGIVTLPRDGARPEALRMTVEIKK